MQVDNSTATNLKPNIRSIIELAMSTRSTRDPSESHGSHSPTAPPYSPITPDPSFATLAPTSPEVDESPYEFHQDPAAMEMVSESDNADVIALRSTIAILQQQRDQSIRDVKTLERQKEEALSDPQVFAQRIVSGKLRTGTNGGLLGQSGDEKSLRPFVNGTKEQSRKTDANSKTPIELIPGPQDVVRVPPIEWAKYHVVGEALEKLHAEQKKHPASGGFTDDGEHTKGAESVVAAPYRALIDEVPGSSKRIRFNENLTEDTQDEN